MAETVRLTPREACKLIVDALIGAGTAPANTGYLADAILETELSGQSGHGFYWLQYYCAHVESGKVKGRVRPSVKRLSAVSFLIDAKNGFAHPAIEAGFAKLIPAAKKHGVAAMGVTRSYSGATLGIHTGYLAKRGLVAFGFTNAMPTIAPIGGRTPVIGTNPLSFAVPGPKGKIPFLIDQSSSTVAWTAVKRAAEQGRAIPIGWALDKDGNPTTDPAKGLEGSMAPFGGYKGFGQGLIVEVMSAAMTGACLGPDMGSFTDDDGRPIGCGQFFIALDPKMFAGGAFAKQIDKLIKSIVSQKGARLPNSRRVENIARLSREGLTLEREIFDRLSGYAAKLTPRRRAGSGSSCRGR